MISEDTRDTNFLLNQTIPEIIVTKRNGRTESFNIEKIVISIRKACAEECSENEIQELVKSLVEEISKRTSITSTEIADRIVRMMIMRGIVNNKWFEIAKRYELGDVYKDVYRAKEFSFDPKDLKLSFAAIKVLKSRYLMKDPESGNYIETPQMMFRRVARAIARIEYNYCIDKVKAEDRCRDLERLWEEKFYTLLSELKFIPNSPTLMNAGTRLGILSACFVLPVRDAIVTPDGEGIYDAVRAQAIIFQQGGGTGFDFSELRPEGDSVATTGGVASGPISFMRMFDVNTDVIKQGGRRRGANMGVLHVWHPDIEKFIDLKSGKSKDILLQNFNISVGVYDYFMYAVVNGGMVPLINPRKTNLRCDLGANSKFYAITRARHYLADEWVQNEIINELEEKGGSVWLDDSLIITIDEAMAIAEDRNAIVRYIDAQKLLEKIVRNAWDSGDPGLIFIDTVNSRHPVWYLGKINATNPCGEQPLLPWESCNLGSIDLSKYVYIDPDGEPRIAWGALAEDLKVIARFMDNVIDAAKWPLPQLEYAAKRTRKIGVGVMGWHHMLIKLGIPYDSIDALYLGYRLAEWIEYNLALASIELSKERGAFPAYDPKLYRPTWTTARPFNELMKISNMKGAPSAKVMRLIEDRPTVDWNYVEELRKKYGIRNATLTSIAPTGTISIIANTSSSIEPIFAVAFEKHVSVGTFIEIDRLFLEYLKRYELDDPKLIETIAERGSISDMYFLPKSIKELFKTAYDIDVKYHVLHQAVWQQWVCAGVSKTINMRFEASIDDVREAYILAWMLGCKGITVYRDKSKTQQVIYVGVKMQQKEDKETLEHKAGITAKFTDISDAVESSSKTGCQLCEY
ncbi:MAG: adenosylcobalamin-dependent ribonucleoside-diphosphate reductase [Ignisphaera sp.]